MPRPTLTGVGPSLDRIYDALPEHYRVADEAGSYTLYRWLAGVAAELGAVRTLFDGIDYVPVGDGGTVGDTSTLTDPAVAPVGYLMWLAQLVGTPLRPDMSATEQRDAVTFASAGWRAGTKAAVADAARSELTGTRYAKVYDHSISTPGDGGEWDVLIITRGSETPDVPRVLQAVVRRAAKPAGVVLYHRAYEAAWDTVSTTYPTWSTLEAAGSWNKIQEAGL